MPYLQNVKEWSAYAFHNIFLHFLHSANPQPSIFHLKLRTKTNEGKSEINDDGMQQYLIKIMLPWKFKTTGYCIQSSYFLIYILKYISILGYR